MWRAVQRGSSGPGAGGPGAGAGSTAGACTFMPLATQVGNGSSTGGKSQAHARASGWQLVYNELEDKALHKLAPHAFPLYDPCKES